MSLRPLVVPNTLCFQMLDGWSGSDGLAFGSIGLMLTSV